MDDAAVIASTRRWVEGFVIGLNLCPFARRPSENGRIRYALTAADSEEALLAALDAELNRLIAATREEIETTLLVHPHALADFLDYNDFLTEADRLLVRRGLRGIVQIASFHPHYQFAGTRPDSVENSTNRSPFPMLHLLREQSITEAAGEDPDRLLDIPQRNIALLRRLGRDEVQRLSGGVSFG